MTTRVLINILDTGGGEDPPIPNAENRNEQYLPTTYEAVDFFVEFEFLVEETILPDQVNEGTVEEEEVRVEPAVSVKTEFPFEQYNITFTEINNFTFRLEGPIFNVFTDQFYQFVLPDMSTPILPFDTQQQFYSLIKYQKPAKNSTELKYDFLINNTIDTSIYQIIVWRYQTAVNNIQNLVSKGLV